MLSIPKDQTLVKNTLVWNGLAERIAFGTAPCLSKNLINLKAALIKPFGTILKAFANASVLLDVL